LGFAELSPPKLIIRIASVSSSCMGQRRVGNPIPWFAFKVWLRGLHPPQLPSPCEVTAAIFFKERLAMRTERFADHHQAREALVLSVASVTAIMVTAYLILLILY
jgi:hypothetical protein